MHKPIRVTDLIILRMNEYWPIYVHRIVRMSNVCTETRTRLFFQIEHRTRTLVAFEIGPNLLYK